jgi:hypothetical protein
VSLEVEDFHALGMAARIISPSPTIRHPQRLAPLPKTRISGQTLSNHDHPLSPG